MREEVQAGWTEDELEILLGDSTLNRNSIRTRNRKLIRKRSLRNCGGLTRISLKLHWDSNLFKMHSVKLLPRLVLASCLVVAAQTSPSDVMSWQASTATSTADVACRDRFLWPFNSSSIWNTAIGSDAVYVPAGIYDGSSHLKGIPVQFHNDQDWLILTTENDPLVPWLDDSGNFPGGCSASGKQKASIPMPLNFTTDCEANNNGAGVLLPDNETLIQMQPLYRATAGGPIVAWYHTGAPQPFPWNISILGDGNLGAHGGSGLSSFGGTVRLGELLNSTGPITHALKLELWAHAYYYFDWGTANYSSCYTWPAIGCDGYWDHPGDGYNGTNPHLKPGALLAIPPSDAPALRANITTAVGLKILDALVDYGGYIVDDTGSENGGGAICMEHGVNDEVMAAYNVSIAITDPLTPKQGPTLYWDLVNIFRTLSVVVNNGPGNVGGGGTPRQPPPPPIC